MILIDANILMYAAGSHHPNKSPSLDLLERIAEDRVDAAIDAEVLQEVLHRYRAIGRWEDGRVVFDQARRIFSIVLPITVEVMDRARQFLDLDRAISARDAVHAGVVHEYSLESLCSYDRGFDRIDSIQRVEPANLTSLS